MSKKQEPFVTRNLYWLILIGFIIFLNITTYYWIGLDSAPPLWDQAHYLEVSNDFYFAVKNQGFGGLSHEWLNAIKIKPPLLSLLILPFYFLFGQSQFSAEFLFLVMIFLFNIFLFLLVKKLFNEKVALTSTVIASTMPLIFGLSRQFFVEYSLMTFVVIWIFILLKSDFLKNNLYNLLLGIFLGLGLLLQITFMAFIAGPLAIILFYRLKRRQFKNILINLGIIIVCGILIVLLWYSKNFITSWIFMKSYLISEYHFPWTQKIISSWIMSIPANISIYYFLLLILLGTIYLYFIILKKLRTKLSLRFYLILSWFIVPSLIFLTFQISISRYTLAIYPSIAIIAGWLLINLVKKSSLIIALLIIPLVFYCWLSFDTGFLAREPIAWGHFLIFSKDMGEFYYPADKTTWPNQEIVNFIAMRRPSEKNALILTVDYQFLNHSNMAYYASLAKTNLQFEWFGCSENAKNLRDLEQKIIQADFLITKTGEQGPESTNCINRDLQQALDTNNLPFAKIATFSAPDNSEVFIYKKF